VLYHRLSYDKEPITYSDAISEVYGRIQNYLESLPEARLILAALSAGANPMKAQMLSEYEAEELSKICRRAYALGEEPQYDFNPFHTVEFDPRKQGLGRFAISYFSDKENLIRDTAETALPRCAADLIHSRVLAQALQQQKEAIEEAPPKALQKERSIREATNGKASIWATFSNGTDTLRMSIPASAFTNDHRLSTFQLTNKDRHRLEEFLFPDKSQRWGSYVQMDHIVALDYKGKTLYLDHDFYNQQRSPEPEKPSIADKLKDAKERAALLNGQNIVKDAKERGGTHEI